MVKSLTIDMLSKMFPNKMAAAGEIVRLRTIMGMPKGTEYFFSDVHGEDKAFLHMLRSASGNIRRKIRDVYRSRLSEDRQNELASIIYDPQTALAKRQELLQDSRWVRDTILQLVEVARFIASKYPRDQVSSKMPCNYRTTLHELMESNDGEIDRRTYYYSIISGILDEEAQEDFITELCLMIQRICVNHIHVVGDIFDRGPHPHTIMEELIHFGNQVDVQWGNHDVVWMGAALGNEVCMMAVMRNAIKYNTFDCLEDGYGIHLRVLDDFARQVYGDDPCDIFMPRIYDENIYDVVDERQAARMHKAVAILEFKLEGQLYERHPEYEMTDRIVLKKVDWETMEYVSIDGSRYKLTDTNFPTIDPKDPLKLTDQEEELLRNIKASFLHSERLQRHNTFLFTRGSSYLTMNGNLLYHGCLPMTEDGEFDGITIDGEFKSGKALMDYLDFIVTQAYYAPETSQRKRDAVDFMWYLWCGPKSPMFGKRKMATFERYFTTDKKNHKEKMNPYFALSSEEAIARKILKEFDLDPDKGHIINGHVPVIKEKGQSPMRANGRLFVIDGGIAKSYQKQTGIAGYTLIYNSHHIALAEHVDYNALTDELETYAPNVRTVDRYDRRVLISDTDLGKEYQVKITALRQLINAYTAGLLKEEVIL
ncbi:fructose-bisphosphatase class III [Kallipyga gabonensis]|uniref:fructose-bisphosphatase class III n=1 Tax=Kallipyga gabonensis TaxID=1686287 RepID=UPI0006B59F37|nr:fructose-bisphosphatase class III [Kallipyga gabonensis]